MWKSHALQGLLMSFTQGAKRQNFHFFDKNGKTKGYIFFITETKNDGRYRVFFDEKV